MIKIEPIVFICHQKSTCFIAFLTCKAWNLHHVHLKLESYGQRGHKKSWNYIRRVTCKTSGPWFEAWRNGSLENELKMITEVKFGSVRAQSRPLTTHPHPAFPWVPRLFHGDNICPNSSQMRKCWSGISTISTVITSEGQRTGEWVGQIRHLWTQGLFPNTRPLFSTNDKY